jgi:polysaccharide biosynthesis/export protein
MSRSLSTSAQHLFRSPALAALLLGAAALALSGCETTSTTANSMSAQEWMAVQNELPESQRLREGNDIRIVFPGAPNLDTAQKIRPDGRITLYIIGELAVAGMTPPELEQELLRRYAGQLASNEVSVTVLSSTFTVWVGGAVLSPGKIQSDRPLTVLEAIMEVGGFQGENARTREVVVMRTVDGKIRRFTINLQDVLDGRSSENFLLRPSDIIYVPKKVSWM